MSNISDASKELKKKLSFNDYSKPVIQQAATSASQQDGETASSHAIESVSQHASVAAYKHTVMPESNHIGMPAQQQADMPAQQHAVKHLSHKASRLSSNSTGKTARQYAVKKKMTFYITEEDETALTNIYIKRLQNKNKTDKSALLSEAIQLLVKREK